MVKTFKSFDSITLEQKVNTWERAKKGLIYVSHISYSVYKDTYHCLVWYEEATMN